MPTARSPPADRSASRWQLAGAGIALVVLVPIAAFARPVLDLVDISPATARIATGLLLAVTGILLVGWPMPTPEPSLPGGQAALVPVAFPTLLTPGLALLTLTASADHSALVALVVLAIALVTLPAMAMIPVAPRGSAQHRVLDGSAAGGGRRPGPGRVRSALRRCLRRVN